jgi:hypothetical protein
MMINKSKNKNYTQPTNEVMQHELKMPKVFPFGEDRGAFLVLLNSQCVPQEKCMYFLVGNKKGDEFFCCPQCYFTIFHSNSQKVPPSFHCVPQDVPNNTTFLSHMFCPKLNTKIKKMQPTIKSTNNMYPICSHQIPNVFPTCFQSHLILFYMFFSKLSFWKLSWRVPKLLDRFKCGRIRSWGHAPWLATLWG